MSYSPGKRMSVLHHNQSTPSEAKMLTNGAGLDPAVRERAIAGIEAFQEVLDDVGSDPSADDRDKLREAADRLMRAVAGVMLELGKQPSG
jgi:hypothetical protein